MNVAVIHGYIVHHKVHLTADNIYDPATTISFDNLELLCMDCHNKEHFSKSYFTDDGQVKDTGKNLLELAGILKK